MIELRHRSESDLELAFGGDTLNFATYFARLVRGRDARIDYITALGDDPYSEAMLALWRAEGIGCTWVARLPGRLPGLYTIRTDAAGERTFTYWRSAAAAREMFKDGRGERLIEDSRHDLLYFTGITLSVLDAEQRALLMRLAQRVRERGGRVAFDSNYRPAGWPDPDEARAVFDQALQRADVALPTFDDERALFGVADPQVCVQRLHALGVAEVVVKVGPDGCHLSSAAFTGSIPAAQVARVVDSTAAGDSFNAGYLVARVFGAAPEAAGRMGNALAARVISHPGAVIPAEAMADLRV